MGFGPSPFSAWQWSKRGRFYPTPVASWPGIYPLLQYSIFCSFPTTTHWSTSSQTRLAHFWQSSPCFCCYAWNVQVKQLNCRCFRFLLDFDFFFTILIWKTEVFRTLGYFCWHLTVLIFQFLFSSISAPERRPSSSRLPSGSDLPTCQRTTLRNWWPFSWRWRKWHKKWPTRCQVW